MTWRCSLYQPKLLIGALYPVYDFPNNNRAGTGLELSGDGGLNPQFMSTDAQF